LRQMGIDLFCIIGSPCHANLLADQWQTLSNIATRNQFLSERLYIASEGPQNFERYTQLYSSPQLLVRYILDGQEENLMSAIVPFLDITEEDPLKEEVYLSGLAYRLEQDIVKCLQLVGIRFEDSDMGRLIYRKFATATNSKDSFLKWITDMCKFCSTTKNTYAEKQPDSYIDVACAFIRQNLAQPLSREIIAAQTHCSPTHLARVFKQKMKQTLTEYIERERIESSKILLQNSALSINKIAEMVGYTSASYYSARFKQREHLSPIQYRFATTTMGSHENKIQANRQER